MNSDIAPFPPHDMNPHEMESQEASLGGQTRQEMPHNFEAEQGLLGMLLIDNNHLEKVSDFLRPAHFSHPSHQNIYATIEKMIERGLEAKHTTLKDYFEKDEGLESVGGAQYLNELANEVPLLNNVYDYANTIYDRYLRREIIRMNQDISSEAFNFNIEKNAGQIIEQAESQLFKLSESGVSQGGFQTLRDSVVTAIEIAEKAYKSDGHVTGITTGLTDLDHKLGGLHNSDLLILAARPSICLLYTSPSPRDQRGSRMPSSA